MSMLCQTIATTLPELLQALWERAVQPFNIICPVDVSNCVGKCSLQLLLQLKLMEKALQASSKACRRELQIHRSQAWQPLLRVTPHSS